MRFNPPPNWPPSPAGWAPPAHWAPPADWPAPPYGWQLWVEDTSTDHYPSFAPAPTVAAGLPNRSLNKPRVAIGAVIGVAIVYVVARSIGTVLQLAISLGDIGPFPDQTTYYVVMGVVWFLSIFASIAPALILLSRKGPRPEGQRLARMCLWAALIPAVALYIASFLMITGDANGSDGTAVVMSGGSDFLSGTAIMVAWISTRRASKWALLAAPLGGLLTIYSVRLAADVTERINDGYSSASAVYLETTGIVAMSSIVTVLVLVGTAWLAYGIDAGVAAMFPRRPLPDYPLGMWSDLTPKRRTALVLAVGALMAAVAGSVGASVYGHGEQHLGALLWAIAVVVTYALLTFSVVSCVNGNLRQSPIVVAALGVALICLTAQTILTMTEHSDASGYLLSVKIGLTAIAVAFIAAFNARPWGLPAALPALLAPVEGIEHYQQKGAVFALLDSTNRTVGVAVVLTLTVGGGVLVSRAVAAVIANPQKFGLQAPQAPPPGVAAAPPMTDAYPQSGPMPQPGPPTGGMPTHRYNDPQQTPRAPVFLPGPPNFLP